MHLNVLLYQRLHITFFLAIFFMQLQLFLICHVKMNRNLFSMFLANFVYLLNAFETYILVSFIYLINTS